MNVSSPSNELYGSALATAVADLLDRGQSIMHLHRDYCGMGLLKEDGNYVYCSVWDGWPETVEQHFTSRTAFIQWLAAQSDHSLHGYEQTDAFFIGNQRITRARIEQALAHPTKQ